MNAFEWDENKRAVNIEKHKIDFVRAIEVFSDPNQINLELNSKEFGEKRTITIGTISNEVIVVIFVVWTSRGNKKRLISARRASQSERKLYER